METQQSSAQPRPNFSGAGYVALGSSYAAGPGLGIPVPRSAPGARRTDANYPHRLASALDLMLTDVTSSGAVTADILYRRQFGQPPQADALTPDTDLVTITVGGNDIGYVTGLVAAGLPPGPARLAGLAGGLQRLGTGGLDRQLVLLEASLTMVGELVRRRAPRARVLFVQYLPVLPPDPVVRVPRMSTRQAASGRRFFTHLAGATARAAAATGATLVPVAAAGADHHAWSDDPWTTAGIRPRPGGPLPFHPNTEGMAAVAAMIGAELTGSGAAP
ncbi:SGNH/GDSL hydrolase family protein [Arthrobacter sp. YD2]|uniref:SGNH/GDSL hydrolase family protein n=1 Tax=Arthrobacter sp. YD2 TaxID=3058046 RepID=UPI0025B3F407|nr:SGNH/GDSL hydrolase family protein [Arthrobacter sp. YD2]MDN3903416.1 SGNH/GDSL hydrolase family protein [Arthrobacter sp. YD2]